MPNEELEDDVEETEEDPDEGDEDDEEGDDPNAPQPPDPVEALAAINEEVKEHLVRLSASIPQMVAQLQGDSPEHQLLRFLALELGETTMSLLSSVADATTEALVQFREWADKEIEPWLEELDEDVGAATGDDDAPDIAEDEVIVPAAVVQSTSEDLGQLRGMIEAAIESATPEHRIALEAMREKVDKNIAGLAAALSEPEDEPAAAAAS